MNLYSVVHPLPYPSLQYYISNRQTHILTHTHTQIFSLTLIHSHRLTHIERLPHSQRNRDGHTHTHTHTLTHTHTHTNPILSIRYKIKYTQPHRKTQIPSYTQGPTHNQPPHSHRETIIFDLFYSIFRFFNKKGDIFTSTVNFYLGFK